jgi:DNA polymerase-3 subunit epsilon/ATP-dependent DNA helicase DinG
VGETLKQYLFADKEAVVLTSATLATADSFSYIQRQLGLEDASYLLLGSPFDYASSTLLCIPEDTPEPEKPFYQHHIQQAIVELCRASKGRALCLFTSHSQLRQTWQGIRLPLEQEGILVLRHGLDGSPRQLLRQFRNNPDTVLLGTASFWEGVDVVGEALSVLVITRLPFSVPTDPIFAARSETFDDPFNDYSLPNAILRFRQGFGRLIRSNKDRGIVVILDRRVISRAYGLEFLRSLPTCMLQRGPLHSLVKQASHWLV